MDGKPRPATLAALIATSALVAGAASVVVLPPAAAQRLTAQVYITQAAIPRGLTEKALIGFARSHQARVLMETNEPQIENRTWRGNLITAFNAPPGDLEYHALFYEVTQGPRNFVDDMAIYLSGRDQKTYVQKINLARPRFRPNKRYEVVITVRRTEVGTTRFETRGEEPRRSGQVDFTEEEARARD
jgi:hypothetical protein